MDIIAFPEILLTTSGLSIFYSMALFHSQTQCHMINVLVTIVMVAIHSVLINSF